MENLVGFVFIVKILIMKVSKKLFNFIYYLKIVRNICHKCGKININLLNNKGAFSDNNIISLEQKFFSNFPNYNNNRKFGMNNQNMINNYYSKSFKSHNSQNNNEEFKCKNKKPFIERPGDWICYNCHNINFAFRTKCNRCQITKNINHILIKENQLMFINNKLF